MIVTLAITVIAATLIIPTFSSRTTSTQDQIAESYLVRAYDTAKEYYYADTAASNLGAPKPPTSFTGFTVGEANARESDLNWVGNGTSSFPNPKTIMITSTPSDAAPSGNVINLCDKSDSGAYLCISASPTTLTPAYSKGATMAAAIAKTPSATKGAGWG